MYRAIIIDDEEAVRAGLRSHFDWERHGVSVAAEFPDCEKAYRYIREHPVELVVTDVVTPHMDGITLARKLRSFWYLSRLTGRQAPLPSTAS